MPSLAPEMPLLDQNLSVLQTYATDTDIKQWNIAGVHKSPDTDLSVKRGDHVYL